MGVSDHGLQTDVLLSQEENSRAKDTRNSVSAHKTGRKEGSSEHETLSQVS